jgi:hypothetical protein
MAFNRDVDEVRDRLIGLKVIDIEPKGRAIYLEDEDGRVYSIDYTEGNRGTVLIHQTNEEKLECLETEFHLLLKKLNIDRSDLWELYE